MKIGDTVLYHYPGPKKADRTRDVAFIRPALVLAVHDDGSADLVVIQPGVPNEARAWIKAIDTDPKKSKADRYEELQKNAPAPAPATP